MTNTHYLSNPKEGYLPTAVKYGFLGILIIHVATYIFYKLGMLEPGNDLIANILSLVLTVVPIALAIDAYKINNLGGIIRFKQALGVGFITSLVLAILGGIVFNFIFLRMIAPDLIATLQESQLNIMLNSGMRREVALQTLQESTLLKETIGYAIFCTIFGALSSLVLAAFMKNG